MKKNKDSKTLFLYEAICFKVYECKLLIKYIKFEFIQFSDFYFYDVSLILQTSPIILLY